MRKQPVSGGVTFLLAMIFLQVPSDAQASCADAAYCFCAGPDGDNAIIFLATVTGITPTTVTMVYSGEEVYCSGENPCSDPSVPTEGEIGEGCGRGMVEQEFILNNEMIIAVDRDSGCILLGVPVTEGIAKCEQYDNIQVHTVLSLGLLPYYECQQSWNEIEAQTFRPCGNDGCGCGESRGGIVFIAVIIGWMTVARRRSKCRELLS